jgi:hypothetical protein
MPGRRRRLRAVERPRVLPDERRLYISDTGASPVDDGPRHIRVFDVGADSTLSGGDVFATCADGAFDGFRVDTQGRIWTSAGEAVECYEPDGTLLGRVLVPRDRLERRVRRSQAQPPVHLRDDIGVLDAAAGQRRRVNDRGDRISSCERPARARRESRRDPAAWCALQAVDSQALPATRAEGELERRWRPRGVAAGPAGAPPAPTIT